MAYPWYIPDTVVSTTRTAVFVYVLILFLYDGADAAHRHRLLTLLHYTSAGMQLLEAMFRCPKKTSACDIYQAPTN